MADSKIEWTEKTWNPIRGCSRISEGCRNCYAERMATRFSGEGKPFHGYAESTPSGPRWTGKVSLIPEMLDKPLRWRKPARVFVNSMSDLFHESLSFEEIAAVFGVMAACPQHTFQVLTKRAERMREFLCDPGRDFDVVQEMAKWVGKNGRFKGEGRTKWLRSLESILPLPNVELGVSVEDQAAADERIPYLLDCPAAVRWVSAEPLLGEIDFRDVTLLPVGAVGDDSPRVGLNALAGHVIGPDDVRSDLRLDWIVVGGESGPVARPCEVSWIRSIIRQCRDAEVPVFVKQDSGPRAGRQGRLPDDLWNVKEYPNAS